MSRGPVPPPDEVTLLCPRTKQEVVDDQILGPHPSAFRIDDDGISVTWIQYFAPPPPSLEQAADAIKQELKPKKSGILAFGQVERILTIAQKLGIVASIVHDPQSKNHGHSLIKGWPDEIGAKVALTRAFNRFASAADIPNFV